MPTLAERFTKAAGEALPDNFTPDNLLDHLQREAFYGVGTVNDGGSARSHSRFSFNSIRRREISRPPLQYSFNAGIVLPNGARTRFSSEEPGPCTRTTKVLRATEARGRGGRRG
jgi:hypothetical protein